MVNYSGNIFKKEDDDSDIVVRSRFASVKLLGEKRDFCLKIFAFLR